MQNPLASASRFKKGDNLLAHFFKRGTKGEGLDAKSVTVTNLSTFHPFNHSTNYPSRLTPYSSRKCAFTLAEVLITLGIIGVVAAITIPMLISKYERHTIEVGIKKTYSDLANIIKRSEADNGSYEQWDPQNVQDFVTRYIAPYVNLRRCEPHHPRDNNKLSCFAGSDGNYFVIRVPWENDIKVANAGRTWYSFMLDDGRSIEFSMSKEKIGYYVNFKVDVNGQVGKSALGVDVFYFTLKNYYRYNDMNRPMKGFHGGNGVNGGDIYYTTENIKKNTCIPYGAIQNLSTCTLLLERNNWKFPKDYPIKF